MLKSLTDWSENLYFTSIQGKANLDNPDEKLTGQPEDLMKLIDLMLGCPHTELAVSLSVDLVMFASLLCEGHGEDQSSAKLKLLHLLLKVI